MASESLSMRTRALSDIAGIEVEGVDLSTSATPQLRDSVMDLLRGHRVVVFRDQDLTPESQAAFSTQFGELEDHVIRLANGKPPPLVHVVSNLDDSGEPTATPHTHGNYFWHTDKSYHAVPSLATILHARELPPVGGATQFADTAAAYSALDDEQKERIAELRVVHSWEASRRNSGNRPATEEEKAERPPVTHPLVRTHPETGEKCLYIGTHTSHVDGMAEDAGRALLKELLEHTTQDSFVYTHEWQVGDVVMWDNRCTLHRAVRDFDLAKHRRVLHRTVIRGTVPE